MKKVFFLSIALCLLFLTGCSKYNERSLVKELNKKVNKLSSYHLEGKMTIYNGDNKYKYDVESSYDNDKYRVSLINNANNHEQIILRNNEGVYVLTPSLNKSFKFQSDWPKNSSQVYLLQSLLNDINKDKNIKMKEVNSDYVIKNKISYSSNKNLDNQKIYLSKNLDFKKVEVYNKDKVLQIEMVFTEIDKTASFNNKYFSTKENMKSAKISDNEELEENKSNEEKKNSTQNEEEQEELNSNKTAAEEDEENNEEKDEKSDLNEKDENNDKISSKEKTTLLEDTIYPMYLPVGTYLSNEETVSKDEGERTILTFAGNSPFILVEEEATASTEFETIPVYGEPTILLDSVGALSDKSANFISNGVEYYLSGDSLSKTDILNVIESINSVSVMK